MSLDELSRLIRRPATRRFVTDRDVPRETVAALVDAARWTGSARNRQPWRFVEVRDRALIEALSRLGAYAQFVSGAPVVLAVAAADNGFADTAFDTGRVTQSLVLAAAALGLGACPATLFPEANVDEARRLLRLDEGWLPDHLVALGYPSAEPAPAAPRVIPGGRLPLETLLTTI
ncbi:MAG: nitroreductase family protein [Solirubrobacteraceae bacterium]|nr:nitroreductase family protein [Patulibacter sp.]